MKRVRVRYAPSPTGTPHIGNIRTALFNYLFAKNQGGQFLLRIEDTDQNRQVPGAIEKIKESLDKLGLSRDEQEVYQSQRLDIYKKHLEILKGKGLAYQDEGAWRFKVEKGKTLQWDDVVHGSVKFSSDVIEDFIIIKSDGFPTYHFASIVDDKQMQISHVFRGDEWISSTPKHLLLYQSFGWEPPKFVHLPPILGEGHKKLSKRDGAKSAIEYIGEGYLPEAIVNFLAFLGWSPKGDREVFTLDELTREFSLDRINKNSPIFNLEKLKWFNKQWLIKKATYTPMEFATAVSTASGYSGNIVFTDIAVGTAPLVAPRMTTLLDYDKLIAPLYEKPVVNEGSFSGEHKDYFLVASKALEEVENWSKDEIEKALRKTVDDNKFNTKDFFMDLRVAVTGSKISMPLNDLMEILGKDKTIARLKKVSE